MVTSCISASTTNKNKMRTIDTYWEDVSVGTRFTTAERTITKDEVIEFAGEYDPQPFHLDEEAAKESILGGLCASGWHTCSIAMRLVYDAFHSHADTLGSPGVTETRWKRPLFVGETVKVTATCKESRASKSKPDMGLTNWVWEMTNEAGDVIMTMESVLMMGRREPAS